MFTNLIESSSHKREFKRRSSFFVATVAAYALLLAAAGIVGILTYDARVEAQNMDLLVDLWIPPVKRAETPKEPAPRPRPPRANPRPNAPVDPHIQVAERTNPTAAATNPEKIPDEIGTKGSDQPPVTGAVVQSTRNVDPPSSGDRNSCATCTGESTGPAVEIPTPEPTPMKLAGPQRVTSVVLVGKAVSLPQPPYPIFAKQIRAQGPVNVQIVVGENGSVISAHAVSGSPALTNAAEDAAKRARFTPTILNGAPVKIQGVITYNFVLQ
jgi:periplasmic protein TonB